jgi:biotin synthase
MGETWRQRIEMAYELRDLGVDEIPLNFLNPRPQTPLGDRPLLAANDALKICAIYRLIFPDVVLRYGGGRELILRDLQALGLVGGVNAMIVGNYLTTTGRPAADDLQLIADLGMPVRP